MISGKNCQRKRSEHCLDIRGRGGPPATKNQILRLNGSGKHIPLYPSPQPEVQLQVTHLILVSFS